MLPEFGVLTRIIIDKRNDNIPVINDIINKWKTHKSVVNEEMNMGIITFYNHYKYTFENNLDLKDDNSISVYTIDSSQGEQFTTTILYLDVKPYISDKKISDFVLDYHRFNVAVSRAVEQLIIIETKEFEEEYKRIKDTIKDEKTKKILELIHFEGSDEENA